MLQFICFYFVLHFSKLLYLSLSDFILASDREGIDNPFNALGASVWLFAQVHRLETCVYLLLDWYLGSQLRKILISTLLHHPYLFKGKTNASSRSSRKNFWRRCGGSLHQAYQVPIINSHLLHYIIRHLPLVFLSPTSKTFSKKHKRICLFIRPSSVVFSFDFWLFVC